MSDTAAIQSRHYATPMSDGTRCGFCGFDWPCDARVEGDRADRAEAALMAAYAERDALAEDYAALAEPTCRCGHTHASGTNGEDAGCECGDGHDWAVLEPLAAGPWRGQATLDLLAAGVNEIESSGDDLPGSISVDAVLGLIATFRAALAASPDTGPETLALCEERERDLRQALLEASYFHVKHDGTPRHPETCHDCRRLAESRQTMQMAR